MVCSVGVRYPNEPSPENAKLLVEVMVRQVVNGRLHGSVLERWWKNREVKKSGFLEKSECFFFGGGSFDDHLASRFIYIYMYILCAVYLYKQCFTSIPFLHRL